MNPGVRRHYTSQRRRQLAHDPSLGVVDIGAAAGAPESSRSFPDPWSTAPNQESAPTCRARGKARQINDQILQALEGVLAEWQRRIVTGELHVELKGGHLDSHSPDGRQLNLTQLRGRFRRLSDRGA